MLIKLGDDETGVYWVNPESVRLLYPAVRETGTGTYINVGTTMDVYLNLSPEFVAGLVNEALQRKE